MYGLNMYDAGIYYQNDRFHIEAEYLYKCTATKHLKMFMR